MITAIVFGIGFSFAAIKSIQWQLRWPVLNRKPFNCSTCLAGWAALIGYFIPAIVLEPLTAFLTAHMAYYFILKNSF
jgi:hypothetical protein